MPAPRFEDFATGPAPAGAMPRADPVAAAAAVSPGLGEAERAAGYEQGYKAGWDDAIGTETKEQGRIGAELARNLQDLSFTFHEARVQVIEALRPLLDTVAETLVPRIAAESLALTLREEIGGMIEDCADGPMELVLSPGDRASVERHLARETAAGLRVVEEPSLAAGQAHLRIGRAERDIDLARACSAITEALAAFLDQADEGTRRHG